MICTGLQHSGCKAVLCNYRDFEKSEAPALHIGERPGHPQVHAYHKALASKAAAWLLPCRGAAER